ncbi:MAG: hypothetical protein LBI04_04455 [Treponema sp.]|jgi:hypothetical protein|nr:hypothetical protein [Treponema sp.]
MLTKNPEKSSEDFWRVYEEKRGEKVLSRGLGKYISGWDEFDEKKWGGLWGLIITTSGGFRFHHFPQNSWMDAVTSRFAEEKEVQEKTIFIPKEKIASTQVIKETKWWKRIFASYSPRLVIRYADEAGGEKTLLFEAEYENEQ